MAGAAVLGALSYARARGVDAGGALEAAGLEPAALAGPDARAPQAAYNRVLEELAARSGDPDFGLHLAERLDLDAFHVLGHVAARSATFGEALGRIAAFSRLLHDAGGVEVEREGSEVRVHPGCRGLEHEVPRQVAELSAASVVVLGRKLTTRSWSARRVEFRHRAPPRVSEHVRIFGVEPRFARPETLVVLEPRVLDLPLPGADPGVAAWLEAYAREALARLPAPAEELAGRVRREAALALQRGAPVGIGAVAARLALTPRTLQRRLADGGDTFAALADAARRELSERWLADPHLSLAEVAFLAGFADPSNFHRAFRRWTGLSPAAWRKRTLPSG